MGSIRCGEQLEPAAHLVGGQVLDGPVLHARAAKDEVEHVKVLGLEHVPVLPVVAAETE